MNINKLKNISILLETDEFADQAIAFSDDRIAKVHFRHNYINELKEYHFLRKNSDLFKQRLLDFENIITKNNLTCFADYEAFNSIQSSRFLMAYEATIEKLGLQQATQENDENISKEGLRNANQISSPNHDIH